MYPPAGVGFILPILMVVGLILLYEGVRLCLSCCESTSDFPLGCPACLAVWSVLSVLTSLTLCAYIGGWLPFTVCAAVYALVVGSCTAYTAGRRSPLTRPSKCPWPRTRRMPVSPTAPTIGSNPQAEPRAGAGPVPVALAGPVTVAVVPAPAVSSI
jgi:hypothetical protein